MGSTPEHGDRGEPSRWAGRRADVWHAMRRAQFEFVLLGVASFVWLITILALFGLLPLAGLLGLDLYSFYSIAAALGWVAGNVYVQRVRKLPGPRWRKRLLLAYLLGPAGVVYLLRALAPFADQQAAPLVPIYGFGVYIIFFLVPVTLRQTAPSSVKLGSGNERGDSS